MFYAGAMRWDGLLEHPRDGKTVSRSLFGEEVVERRFHTPEFNGMTFYEVRARSIINHVKGGRLGFRWTINPYRGCSHACVYCFARPTHNYLDMDAGRDFESKIVVKVNAVELLERELRRPSWACEHIAMGTNTDNYQRAEGRYRLMPGILRALNGARNPYSILTKSTLIQRDIELLVEGAALGGVSAAFSVGTVDEEVWRKTEPGTPHPLKRLEVLRKLNRAGVPCGILMAPILPGISDSPRQLQDTVRAAAEAGAVHITPLVLHLRPGVKEEFMPWLARSYPELLATYRQVYRGASAAGTVARPINLTVRQLKTRYGDSQGLPEPARRARPERSGNQPGARQAQEQMTLQLDGQGVQTS